MCLDIQRCIPPPATVESHEAKYILIKTAVN